ncbi:unnamed protein product [Cuscuta campestris]|uniref:Uncharacterized protein n=1 Tax=Cuscuta campestris TaxID=132261 RepID=A0A484KF12_9ASTE|nr:unnamed protein product [Cuscuta campestris]
MLRTFQAYPSTLVSRSAGPSLSVVLTALAAAAASVSPRRARSLDRQPSSRASPLPRCAAPALDALAAAALDRVPSPPLATAATRPPVFPAGPLCHEFQAPIRFPRRTGMISRLQQFSKSEMWGKHLLPELKELRLLQKGSNTVSLRFLWLISKMMRRPIERSVSERRMFKENLSLPTSGGWISLQIS